MVLTKELNQKVVIAAILLSFGLIVGSIYLHIRQKHHFGRLNIGDDRVQPTAGVDKLPKNKENAGNITTRDDIVIQKTKQIIQSIEDDYSSATSKEYANDEPYTTVAQYGDIDSAENFDEGTSTDSYVIDNDYTNQYNLEYEYANSKENLQTSTVREDSGIMDKCLRCLCKTVSNCSPVKCASKDPCGVYGISKFYWIDGGKQNAKDNLNDYSTEDAEYKDYLRCVNNEKCATDTVKSYLKRYQRDCNNDGVIDCQDYIALHVLGPSGCANAELSTIHRLRMNSCLK
ncbi:uncharacterized protein [Musca autumnalis]|uniref:uncharacterized protein n=1 Tax=Musca autumnalis TaxID=221902 RepID=UPI003CF21EAE